MVVVDFLVEISTRELPRLSRVMGWCHALEWGLSNLVVLLVFVITCYFPSHIIRIREQERECERESIFEIHHNILNSARAKIESAKHFEKLCN